MKPSLLRYDSSFMQVQADDIVALEDKLLAAKRQIQQDWRQGAQGWLGCPDDAKLVKEVLALAKKFSTFETCLVIGIGGSDLGTRAAYQALRVGATGIRLEFLGANTDPDEIADVLSRLNPKKTIVNIISKSGDTVEPMSTFFFVREYFSVKIGAKKFTAQVIATTDSHHGSLRELSATEGYVTLPVPKNIGGRFSILSAVGLFPLACAGISISQILNGARLIRDEFLIQAPKKNAPTLFAAAQCLSDAQGKHIHVVMPYVARLQEFGRWYRQLWAESLGKKLNREGEVVYAGPTPVAALGATDQHSQNQLYMEGPNDKTITFIRVEKNQADLKVPADISRIEALSFLAKKSFTQIIHAEQEGTAQALAEAGRANGTISMQKLDAQNFGALIMFFEIAVAVAGELLQINTYDQPGVENSKNLMRQILASGRKH